MHPPIVSTTQIQRNFKSVLEKLRTSDAPITLVRDSIPEAVLLPYHEYERMKQIESAQLKQSMQTMLRDISRLNAAIPDTEVEKDIRDARHATRRR